MPTRHKYAYISATSNTVVTTSPGTLYSIAGTFVAGGGVRVDDADRFAQGTLDVNAVSSNTLGFFSTQFTSAGIGFNEGLAVAVSSNSKITVEYE